MTRSSFDAEFVGFLCYHAAIIAWYIWGCNMAKVNLNILIDAELKARIKALAEQENRTLSNLVETELKRVAATGQSAQTESKNRRG